MDMKNLSGAWVCEMNLNSHMHCAAFMRSTSIELNLVDILKRALLLLSSGFLHKTKEPIILSDQAVCLLGYALIFSLFIEFLPNCK